MVEIKNCYINNSKITSSDGVIIENGKVIKGKIENPNDMFGKSKKVIGRKINHRFLWFGGKNEIKRCN